VLVARIVGALKDVLVDVEDEVVVDHLRPPLGRTAVAGLESEHKILKGA
jgi:hypothetical protein